ncbi:META domain-containing protein [Flavobacteriaceae bacterium R38]|nr:META domain-containing protein [Flavobacteriaceae bacterium R38]
MKNFVLLLSIVTFLMFSSCSEENEIEPDVDVNNSDDAVTAIINTEQFEMLSGDWVLNTINLSSGTELTPPSLVSISFSKEESDTVTYELNGVSTCNLYGGELLSLNNDKISFEELYSTDQLCEEELNNFEATYFELLYRSERYTINNDQLILFIEDGVSINFERSN